MASPERTETVALVAAYREQFQVDGPEPLGAETAGSQCSRAPLRTSRIGWPRSPPPSNPPLL